MPRTKQKGVFKMLLTYLKVFLTGGIICMIGQILINKTKMTSARILVPFMVAGVLLEGVGIYQYIVDFGKAGATIPIIGFGRTLAKGVIKEVSTKGILGIFTGGLTATAAGIAASVIFSFFVGLIFHSKTKKS